MVFEFVSHDAISYHRIDNGMFEDVHSMCHLVSIWFIGKWF